MEVIPRMLDKIAMYMALLSMATDLPMIVNAPLNKRLAPLPATERPIMSMAELVAAAHSVDPTS